MLTVDYVFPDPNTEIGEPDPAVWGSSGNLGPQPDARVTKIVDPDNNASLLYLHSATEIGDVANASTFRGIAAIPASTG